MEPMFPKEMLLGSAGHLKTRALFIETCLPTDTPFLSLKPQKDNGMVSLRDLFILYVTDDPSEATFAETVFGDMRFWDNLCKCTWMESFLAEWRHIADSKRKSKAFKTIMKELEDGGRSSFTAAKYLIEEPWKDKRNPAVKKSVEESTNEAYGSIADDVARIQGTLQ